jgi:hypothetical protein
LRSSLEFGNSDANSRLVIGGGFSMGTPTTFRDYRLSSAALEITELMVGKVANRIRVVPFHRILPSGNLRLSPSGRWRERRPVLYGSLPPQPSIQLYPLRVSSDARHASSLEFIWRSVFGLRDCRPCGRCRARCTTLSSFSHFILMREVKSSVTPRHRRSDVVGNPSYLA